MSHYTHFTIAEREKILFFLAQSKSLGFISKELNRSKSSISREIKRNSDANGIYSPSDAQRKYLKRRENCRAKKMLVDELIHDKVQELFLQHQWSPEQISNRLKLENNPIAISYSTIYRGIYAGLLEESPLLKGQRGVARKLRHRGKTRHTKGHVETRGKIRISYPIEERPEIANNRERIGDWEADTVAGQTGKACLVTLTDRKSRFLLCEKVAKKASHEVSDKMIKMLSSQPKETITPDRGKEFAQHSKITNALGGIPFYFPAPHHPWERGTNENTNGLLREYFPKSMDITDTPDNVIQEKVLELNKRPRKCLNWKTPYEVYYEKVLHLLSSLKKTSLGVLYPRHFRGLLLILGECEENSVNLNSRTAFYDKINS